jgi:hypothetical protein
MHNFDDISFNYNSTILQPAKTAAAAAPVVQSPGLFSFSSRPDSSSNQQHQVINVAFELVNIIISG